MIDVVAMDEWRIVVPVRFARAVSGQSAADAPDIDDRGYKMGERPSVWGTTTIRGPMFGVTVGQTVRVKLVREDIDDTAPLFVVSTDTTKVTVQEADGGPVGADGIFHVHGVAHGGNTATSLEVHLGSSSGPVIAQADVRAFAPLRIPITPHFVRIDTTSTVGSTPSADIDDIRGILHRVQAIWNPCGVVFRLGTAQSDHITLPSNTLNTIDMRNLVETDQVLHLQRTRLGLAAGTNDQTLNLYVVQTMSNPNFHGTQLGVGISRQSADHFGMTDTGIIIAADGLDLTDGDNLLARLVAHEIGHFFRLQHVQQRNNDNPVTDTFGRRQLMYPFVDLSGGTNGEALPRFDDVGYGSGSQGCLITMKNHAHHSTDGEAYTARIAIEGNNWF